MTRPKGLKRAAILDIDGTLLNSNDAHAHAWREALEEIGVHLSYHRIRNLMGEGGDQFLEGLTGFVPGSLQEKVLSARRGEIYRSRYFSALDLFPLVPELLAKMRSEGIRMTVASSAPAADLVAVLRRFRLEEFFESPVSADDAAASKPSPDLIELAVNRLGGDRRRIWMLGDTPYDIQAASRAGVSTIAFRSGGWSDFQLQDAVAVYDGPADLLARFAESPFQQSGQAAA